MIKIGLVLWVLVCSCPLIAQDQDTVLSSTMDAILLTETRSKMIQPWTFAVDTFKQIDLIQSSLRNALNRQTGIFATNGENFAQDLKISIRGFGSRSAFGIRGIKMLIDGIPLTSPDGTTQIDEVAMFDIQAMEAIRSGMAAILGNASGGGVALKTTDFFDGIQALAQANTYGAYQTGLKYGSRHKKMHHLLSLSHQSMQGKREFTRSKTTNLYYKSKFFLSNKTDLQCIFSAYNSPIGEDAGALTEQEFKNNAFQANARNLKYQAGESVSGLMAAMQWRHDWTKMLHYQGHIFYRKRDFQANLPFESGGKVYLDRDFLGMVHKFDWTTFKNVKISIGQNTEYQIDTRTLYNNVDGIQGPIQADQNESVLNLGFFQQATWENKVWKLHQLWRWDYNLYRLDDLYTVNGDQTGKQKFRNFNGALAVSFNPKNKLQYFTNVSTNFEMPTLNELVNNPNGQGFNPELQPEKSTQIEVGLHHDVGKTFKMGASWYYIWLKNMIINYEQEGMPNRTFYRNAFQTNRHGLDVFCSIRPSCDWLLSLNYSHQLFTFQNYFVGSNDYSNHIQAITPRHRANLFVQGLIGKKVDVSLWIAYQTAVYLNDQNSDTSPSYMECNMSISSHQNWFKDVVLGLQINNIANGLSFSNLRANAAGQRYYEAASPMHLGFFVRYFWSHKK